jgi:hypothetical protein
MDFIDLSNSLYSLEWSKNLIKKIDLLINSDKKDNKFKGIYYLSLLGRYTQAEKLRDDLCKDNNWDFCSKKLFELKIFNVQDIRWNNLEKIKLSVNWKKEVPLQIVNKLKLYNNYIHRAKISKKGYTDYFIKINLNSKNNQEFIIEPKLIKAEKIVKLNPNKINILNTKNFEYKITKINQDLEVAIFDINNEQAQWTNLLNLDSFDESGNFVWTRMISYWMPLIKFYKWNKEIRLTWKVIWKWKIQNIDDSMDFINVPKNKYLSKKELDKYWIPSFWILDQDAWVWRESKMKILDKNWNYEFKM